MISDTFDESEFETIQIESARVAVLYSFLVQGSLTPLDLSACEYSLMLRPFFTEEQCKNIWDPSRRILYTLHLDLPKDIERSLGILELYEEGLYMKRRPLFHLPPIRVRDMVYNRDLAPVIVNDIKLANDKAEKLRRYLNIMKLLKLDRHRVTSNFIFDSIIHVLYPDCLDSNLVVEFAETYSLYSWILEEESTDIVGFVLEHARRLRYNILASFERRLDPINACIVYDRTGNIDKLLEYGTAFVSECHVYMLNLEVLGATRRNLRWKTTETRIFLLTMLLYVFMYYHSSWAELQIIWRSIPDPYLSSNEIYFAIGGLLSSTFVDDMIDYNKSNIAEENVHSENLVPRPLLHLCRVAIRNRLSRNFQLPHGISQLGMPTLLKKYLNLRC